MPPATPARAVKTVLVVGDVPDSIKHKYPHAVFAPFTSVNSKLKVPSTLLILIQFGPLGRYSLDVWSWAELNRIHEIRDVSSVGELEGLLESFKTLRYRG